MKRLLIVLGWLVFVGISNDALAAAPTGCRGDRIADIQTALENKFVCAARTNGKDTWSEEHNTGGILVEYAKGPNNPVDPRKQVGTWSVLANNTPGAQVRYNYTGDPNSPYTWTLFSLGNNSYLFCTNNGLTPVATANITSLPVNPSNPCPARQ
jgi:hypothetical protein